MRRHLRLVVVLSVVALSWVTLPSVATAQEREGMWWGVGGGVGSADVSCDDCERTREGSGVGYLFFAWALNEQLLLGFEVDFHQAKRFADVKAGANFNNVSGTLTYYPTLTSGFFAKGGAGAAVVGALDSSSNGPGLLAGAGYDLRVGEEMFLTPAVNVRYGQVDHVPLPSLNNWTYRLIDFTLGITFGKRKK